MIVNDVTLLWASKEYYTDKTPQIDHVHEENFHYVFILGGSADVLLDNKRQIIDENVLYITKAGENHGFVAASPTGLFTIELKFYISEGSYKDRLVKLKQRLYHCSPRVRQLMLCIIEEGIHKKGNYKEIVNLRLGELLLILIRELSDEQDVTYKKAHDISGYQDKNEKVKDESSLKHIALYIHEHFNKTIDLDTMAKMVNMSKGHFIGLFKREFGMTPVKYLNIFRIAKAKELLKASSYNVNEIATLTGFQDARYFSRIFKQSENMTPSDFINLYRKNIYIFLTDKTFIG